MAFALGIIIFNYCAEMPVLDRGPYYYYLVSLKEQYLKTLIDDVVVLREAIQYQSKIKTLTTNQ